MHCKHAHSTSVITTVFLFLCLGGGGGGGVGGLVGGLVTMLSCAKTAERIELIFIREIGMDHRYIVLDWGPDLP
jgi:hypothetical protein